MAPKPTAEQVERRRRGIGARGVAAVLSCAVVLGALTTSAQAVVVHMGPSGPSAASFPTDSSNYFGVALVPGTAASVPSVSSSFNPPACDPLLAPALSYAAPTLAGSGLCFHNGSVLHQNDTFALYWDPQHTYFTTTKNYVDQFLQDVGTDSGTFGSPYAVTSQYSDGGGHAAYTARFRGAYTDFGRAYPASGCPVTGVNHRSGPDFTDGPNSVCLTDTQLRSEVANMIQDNALSAANGYTPLFVLLTPPGVETCLDTAGTLCSANGASAAQFCSYHSHFTLNGTEVAYVVQPWTAETSCDEPDSTPIPTPVDVQQLANLLGQRLVSPLSQGQIATIVNPFLDGWFAANGGEVNDNGCIPLANKLDTVTIAGNSYLLQREFNNAGVIVTDPNSLACTPSVALQAKFVAPNAVNPGDQIQLDGSNSIASLLAVGYSWDFGDGTTASTASVVHSYERSGTYSVTLTVTDRGGNTANLTQKIVVLGPSNGPTTPAAPTGPTGPSGPATPGATGAAATLHAAIRLLPASLRKLIRSGLPLRLLSSERADGLASILISRRTARRAHIRAGRGLLVVIGRGTVSGVQAGTTSLRLRIGRGVAKKLAHLGHVTLTLRLMLVDAAGNRVVIDVAGRY